MLDGKEYLQKKIKAKPFTKLYIRYPFQITALAIVKILVRTPVTPNMVSFAGLFVAFFTSLIIAFADSRYVFLAIPLLFVFDLSGILDGTLARATKIFSPFGSWIGIMAGRIGYMMIGTAFAWYAYKVTRSAIILTLCFIALILREAIGTLGAITISKMPPGWADIQYSEGYLYKESKFRRFLIKMFFYGATTYTLLICLGIVFKAPFYLILFMVIYGLFTYIAMLLKIGRSVRSIKLKK